MGTASSALSRSTSLVTAAPQQMTPSQLNHPDSQLHLFVGQPEKETAFGIRVELDSSNFSVTLHSPNKRAVGGVTFTVSTREACDNGKYRDEFEECRSCSLTLLSRRILF